MDLKLPLIVTKKSDLVHLYRDFSMYCNALDQHKIRQKNGSENSLKIPDNVKAFALENNVDINNLAKCKALLDMLNKYQNKVVAVHISFPAEASEEFLQKIVKWFRDNVDQKVVLKVGLQPSIAAGVIVRTPNKQFDFSLRKHLYDQKHKLKEVLNSGV